MDVKQNVSLRDHSTMRLGGNAAFLTEVTSRLEVEQAVAWAAEHNVPAMMIGDGSNIVWRDEGYPGLIIVNKIMGFEQQAEDNENVYITAGGGENWDSVVARTVGLGLTGIEALSLIPGTVGATPVQNVGAYGQEIMQTLVSVEAYDNNEKRFVTIPGFECAFGYRTSRFKTTDRGRFFITGITLHLMRGNPLPPYYRAVAAYFEEYGVSNPTPQILRDAVIAIRRSKLPDPAQVANNGSFFANPIVDEGTFAQIQADHGDVPHWPIDDGRIKLSAAWLVEQAGFKDVHDAETGMATWSRQPLVLVNERAQFTAQLIAFKQKIVNAVAQKFGITLQQEPELLP